MMAVLMLTRRDLLKLSANVLGEIPVQHRVASLVSSVHTAMGKSLQKTWQGAKKDVYVLICENNICKIPLATA